MLIPFGEFMVIDLQAVPAILTTLSIASSTLRPDEVLFSRKLFGLLYSPRASKFRRLAIFSVPMASTARLTQVSVSGIV